eukprot:753790-Hanusia_phi.AAC.11
MASSCSSAPTPKFPVLRQRQAVILSTRYSDDPIILRQLNERRLKAVFAVPETEAPVLPAPPGKQQPSSGAGERRVGAARDVGYDQVSQCQEQARRPLIMPLPAPQLAIESSTPAEQSSILSQVGAVGSTARNLDGRALLLGARQHLRGRAVLDVALPEASIQPDAPRVDLPRRAQGSAVLGPDGNLHDSLLLETLDRPGVLLVAVRPVPEAQVEARSPRHRVHKHSPPPSVEAPHSPHALQPGFEVVSRLKLLVQVC